MKTYSIICSHGRKRDAKGKWAESIVQTGLPYEQAKAECDRLAAMEQPGTISSWTRDVFFLQMEQEPQYAIFRNDVMVKEATPLKQAEIDRQRLQEEARRSGSKDLFYLQLQDF